MKSNSSSMSLPPSGPENLSAATLEDILQQLMDSATLASAPYVPAIKDAVATGTGVIQWSMICNPNDWAVTPKCLYIHPSLYWNALKVLRGARWHHKHTARWRYLVRRGARK